ncbi:MAG: Metal dependent phosphohydrolase [Parcubacteria group bacterium GW2011_GWA2_39_18]|nr:MAG: Metal dependent phosphohydrolase [Parcubacteria group bacterium GW2011_GWA2_39_18]
MKKSLQEKLIKIAQKRQIKTDPSHDFQHVWRVFNLAVQIGRNVKADLDIVIPAALFHDTVIYRKDHPNSKNETDESAEIAGKILTKISGYPRKKIESVKVCIRQCSFTKGIKPDLLESKVLQDADLLESTGVISIMRTFSSCGHMNRVFYNPKHPFFKKGEINFKSGVGLFYRRLLVAENRMHTKFAKQIAKRRTAFLKEFLSELKLELKESKVITE